MKGEFKSFEEFTLLCSKSKMQRLDIWPFILAYVVITYLSIDYFEEILYAKFLYLITFFIHGMIFLIGNWRISWKINLQFSSARSIEDCREVYVLEHCKDGTTKQEIVPKDVEETTKTPFIHYHKKKFIWNADKKTFQRVRPHTKYPLSYFHEEVSSDLYVQAKQFDANIMDFPMPDFSKIFKEQVMDPLNFFQLFSVALWFFDDNFFHPILTIVMVMVSIFSVSIDRMTTMMNLRSLILKPQHINVYRQGKWAKLSSAELRPGDLVSIVSSNKVKEIASESSEQDDIDLIRKNIPFGDKVPRKFIMKMYSGGKNESKPVLPCDLVVMAGSCVVDESILTGESIPLIKDSILHVSDKTEILEFNNKHKANSLFCGTEVLQTFPADTLPTCISTQPPDNGAIAYVLKTGFDTAKGKLSRSVIFNNENYALKQTEAFILLGLLLILSIVASLYVLNEGLKDEDRDKQKLFLRCIMIITSVVPPELPMIMNISINNSLVYLKKKRIFCTEPIRIPLAGRIDVCAFDKTGTLTTDKLEVHGVCVDMETEKIAPSLDQAISSKPQVAWVMGGCNTVVMHEGNLLGDPIEKLFFDNSGWKFNPSLKMSYNSKKSGQQVHIKFTHPFRSDLKRMCAVCKTEGFDSNGYYGLVKGAPEVIGNFLKNKPKNYDHCAFKLMKEGYRVLALAYKPIPNYSNGLIEREDLECDLELAGLLVLYCPMKRDTPRYIQLLKEANYRNIMITGDNMFTAAKTGQDLNFGPSKKNLFLKRGKDGFEWFDVDDKLVDKATRETTHALAQEYSLSLEGPELTDLFRTDQTLMKELIYSSVIFARVSPDQKELIVKELKDKGLKVLMCGDGTNDVGGLKRSDVGIALVGIKEEPTEEAKKEAKEKKKEMYNEAMRTRNMAMLQQINKGEELNSEFKSGDACIAAPFTNKFTNSLKCVITILRQGVCTLTTTIQTYRTMTLQSLIYAYTMTSLHLENLKTSDAQNTCIGIYAAYFTFQLSSNKPVKKLPKIRPEQSIFNLPFWLSVLGQAGILLFFMRLCMKYAKEYTLEEEKDVDNEEEFKPTFRASMMFLYELASMFCITIFNHEGEPFMTSLVQKGKHFKFIMLPLFLILIVCLDMSEMINELLQITLETKPEFEDANLFFCFLLVSMVGLLYGWTRFIKYLRFKSTFGWL